MSLGETGVLKAIINLDKNISILRQITCNNVDPFVNVFSVCTGDDRDN